MGNTEHLERLCDIAIIGMAGRFPGADDLEQFWNNLRDGVESITFFGDEELLAAGVDPDLLSQPDYIKARAIVSDADCFDATFFGINPREAELTDPQRRVCLEYAWRALENAGYDAARYAGRIGVYVGQSMNTYLLFNLFPAQGDLGDVSPHQLMITSDKDFLATQISYKLNLRGPSLTVQTACSTSLVAVHLACQGLLNLECDMALAGGVSVMVPQVAGYLYVQNGILSPDGHCRPFDARAQGTVSGNGVGLVVLKRLSDALADRDTILAVIKGFAINNDGARKIGYTAPSEDGQVEVITEALTVADIPPETITYVEAHGTATALGDPIEMAALTRAFRASTEAKGFCGLGSVKSNVGHLDAAAGVAGLIKTALALKHKQLPPSLHFSEPNPQIDFANSPFYVNAALREWKSDGRPRRAGVSSFGIGGTNVHMILEEAPPLDPSGPSRPWQLLTLSAKTETALAAATANLAAHLEQNPDLNLADAAYTLQTGRKPFDYRRIEVCRDTEDAVSALRANARPAFTDIQRPGGRPITFMFPGVGDHYLQMAKELYEEETAFHDVVERCCSILYPYLGAGLYDILYPPDGLTALQADENGNVNMRAMLGREEQEESPAAKKLKETMVAQPAVFVIEYALARLLMSWGVQPQAMVGYSLGEYVAACLSGVLSLEDALKLVAERAQMIQALPQGNMLTVSLSKEAVQPLLSEEVSLAIHSGETTCVLAGPLEAMACLQAKLTERGIACRLLGATHPLHSNMMAPLVGPLTELAQAVKLNPPRIPYISDVTGTWITPEQATDPAYWSQHMCQSVRFFDALGALLSDKDRILLEVGPGQSLGSFAKQHPACAPEQVQLILPTMRYAYDRQSDVWFLLQTLGQMWLAGMEIDWSEFYANERRRRVPLPTYPFERRRYWIEPGAGPVAQPASIARNPNTAEWFYIPSWKRTMRPTLEDSQELGEHRWLLFSAGDSMSAKLAQRLLARGDEVITVLAGGQFAANDGTYTIRPAHQKDYESLFAALGERGQTPTHIVHLWNVVSFDESVAEFTEQALQYSFYSLLFLAQAIEGLDGDVQLTVVSSNMQKAASEEIVYPEKAALLGLCRVIPQEMSSVSCCSIDIVLPEPGSRQEAQLAEWIVAELQPRPSDLIIAYRGYDRLVQTYELTPLAAARAGENHKLREGGVYMITGGLGGMGLALADHLVRSVQAKLVLTTRSPFPAPEAWEEWLAAHDPQDRISLRIQALRALEALGAEVLVMQADVTNRTQMEAVVRAACERWGTIHGVIHAAGLPGGGSIQLKTEAVAARVLNPKVHGTRVLDIVLRDIPLDFMVLCSSIAAVVGAPGQVDYCAANAFMDAFANARGERNGTMTVAINWDMWREVGLAVNTPWNYAAARAEQAPQAAPTGHPQGIAEAEPQPAIHDRHWHDISQALATEEGIEVFRRILAHNCLPQIIVSTRHLPTLVQHAAQARLPGDTQTETPIAKHARPNMRTPYTAPRTQVEEELAAIWSNVLGVEQVGVQDSFLDLGGHSLLATQVLSRVRNAFRVSLHLREFFESPTIADLAQHIETLQWATQGLAVPYGSEESHEEIEL